MRLVQGIERGVWKWSASVGGTSSEQTRPAAVTAADKAIDRALVGRTELTIAGRPYGPPEEPLPGPWRRRPRISSKRA